MVQVAVADELTTSVVGTVTPPPVAAITRRTSLRHGRHASDASARAATSVRCVNVRLNRLGCDV